MNGGDEHGSSFHILASLQTPARVRVSFFVIATIRQNSSIEMFYKTVIRNDNSEITP